MYIGHYNENKHGFIREGGSGKGEVRIERGRRERDLLSTLVYGLVPCLVLQDAIMTKTVACLVA